MKATSTMKKTIMGTLLAGAFAIASALPAQAQERGRVMHADDFNVAGTFAENWKPRQGTKVVPSGGAVEFTSRGQMTMNHDTPRDFWAEMEVVPRGAATPGVLCGFSVETVLFGVTPDGKWNLRYIPLGREEMEEKSGVIAGYEKDKAVRIALARVVEEEAASYRFLLDGLEVASARTAPPTAATSTSCRPLAIECRAKAMTLDNFSLCGVKRAGESPNLIINSGFEYAEDGFPTYICRNNRIRAELRDVVSYDDYINLWALDTEVKHSGKQSLRIKKDRKVTDSDVAWMWGHATEKGRPAVFSAWLKSDVDGLEVHLNYGGGRYGSKSVKVGTEWKRYEIAVTNSPGRGPYPGITIALPYAANDGATLWIDDMQAEFIEGPVSMEDIESGKTFATEYRPSDADQVKFNRKDLPRVELGRAPAFTVPRLPAGVKPSVDLDGWKDQAVKLDQFFVGQRPAANKTEVYVACDDKNIYVAYRNFGEKYLDPNASSPSRLWGAKARSVEAFFDPDFSGQFYQFFKSTQEQKVIGARRDPSWKSTWSAATAENKEAGSVDYFLTIPLVDFASPRIRSKWPVNFGRNDAQATECACTAKTYSGGFQEGDRWAIATVPEEIVRRYRIGVEKVTRAGSPGSEVYTVHIANKSGSDRTVKAECFNASESDAKVAEKTLTIKDGETVSFECTAGKPMRLARVELKEKDVPVANGKVLVVADAPVRLMSRLNYYMNEPEAVFRVDCTLAEPEKLRAVVECAGKKVEAVGAASFKVSFPLAGIADGEHLATVKMLKADGGVAATAGTKLVKRPYTEFSTQVNHFTRSLMHGGKPVFMFAPFIGDYGFMHSYTSNTVPHDIAFFKKTGFNAIHFLVPLGESKWKLRVDPVETAIASLKSAEEHGMLVDMWIGHYDKRTKEDFDALKKRLESKALLYVQVLDEPELGQCTSDEARDTLRRMRAEFPYYPVVMNNTVLGIPNRFGNLETDILMIDAYLTNMEGGSVAGVVAQTDIMREVGKEDGKPCYYFVVGSNFPLHYKEPSYREQMAQCYGNVAAGCTGLSFFYAYPRTPGNWRAYKQLAKEFGVLGDVIVSEEECLEATCDADTKALRFITRRHDGHLYIIACNIGTKPLGKVSFSLPSAYRYAGKKAEVLFDGREIDLADGQVVDSIGPLERRVYRVKVLP